MLPDRQIAKWWALRCPETSSLVLLNALGVVDQTTRIFWRVYSSFQNATKSNNRNVQISDPLGVLAMTPKWFWCILIPELYSPGEIIIMYVLNSTIQLTIFLLHILIQILSLHILSSTYLYQQDWLQARCDQYHLIKHSFTQNLSVQQLLRQVQNAFYQSVWIRRSTYQHNQLNHAVLSALLESPPHNLEIEYVIFTLESSYTT